MIQNILWQHQQHPYYWRCVPSLSRHGQQPTQHLDFVQQDHQPPASRQRTAIACGYCRRRKIRCSGFEATVDGRCSNCDHMDKECVFTSVSGQDQAFVPAHTVLRGVVQPPPMYGAHGQPLPPASHGVPSGQLSRQSQSPLSSAAGPCPVHYDYGPLSACSDNASRDALADRKRLHPGPHTPTLPPPHPGSASQAPHQGNGEGYACPEPPSVIPAASTANTPTHYSSAPPPAQPYYTARPPSQASPQSACHYEPSCTSSSPDSQAPTLPGISLMPYYAAPPQPNGALQPPPACSDGRTLPPSTSTPPPRPSMRINDLVSDNGPSRNSIDSSMVNMLNRRPM